MKKLRLILPCIVLCLMTGCGFHLRGQVTLPEQLHHMAIHNAGADGTLERLLTDKLSANNIRIVQDVSQAQLSLQILSDSYLRSLASLSSNTQLRQYTLTYTVSFELVDHHGKSITPVTRVTAIRHFAQNPNQLLGSESEERTLKLEMQREVSVKIINHLNASSTRDALQNKTKR